MLERKEEGKSEKCYDSGAKLNSTKEPGHGNRNPNKKSRHGIVLYPYDGLNLGKTIVYIHLLTSSLGQHPISTSTQEFGKIGESLH